MEEELKIVFKFFYDIGVIFFWKDIENIIIFDV